MHTATAFTVFLGPGERKGKQGMGNGVWDIGLGYDRLIYFLCHLELRSGTGRMETTTKRCTPHCEV
jgi:hypothetical protein